MGTIENFDPNWPDQPLGSEAMVDAIRRTAERHQIHLLDRHGYLGPKPEEFRQEGNTEIPLGEILRITNQFPHLFVTRVPEATMEATTPLQEPHFQKQPRIPESHRDLVEEQIFEWIKLGLVRRADSMFNTPLRCIKTTDGWKVVQDFRELNAKRAK